MGIYMKIEENCSRCGKYAPLKDGLCPRCRKEDKEKEGK